MPGALPEVIITLGSEGSLVYVDDTFYEIPAYPPHEVVDATGCGDTYWQAISTSACREPIR